MSSQPPNEREDKQGDEERVEVTTPRARQGVTTGHMRWVLRLGLVLAVIGLFAAWLWL